ncbi:unnamed protein product [Linum trigynum]|uniref:Uncharacterized protein n=1 Tax=Linum trigynum TaxID=586398 RepID=A0AAV2CR50_9ROSI
MVTLAMSPSGRPPDDSTSTPMVMTISEPPANPVAANSAPMAVDNSSSKGEQTTPNGNSLQQPPISYAKAVAGADQQGPPNSTGLDSGGRT